MRTVTIDAFDDGVLARGLVKERPGVEHSDMGSREGQGPQRTCGRKAEGPKHLFHKHVSAQQGQIGHSSAARAGMGRQMERTAFLTPPARPRLVSRRRAATS